MTPSRYTAIRLGHEPITKDEIQSGWHFCRLAGGKLIGPGMDGFGWCDCLEPKEEGKDNCDTGRTS